MSIFISIASYRDPELVRTVNSAIENADNPEELFFALVIQEFQKKMPRFEHLKNVKVFEMNPKEAQGVGYARAIAMNMYDGEDYFLQIDSHTIFTKGWDTECIKQLKLAQSISNNDKVIISAFPQPYIIESNRVNILKKSDDHAVYPMKQIPFQRDNGDWTAKRIEFENDDDLPETSSTILAGFIFTIGKIVEEVPYDPEIAFLGEELCFAIRAWTRGWDIYSPKKVILYHYYMRTFYNKIWKDSSFRQISWKELEDRSKHKQHLVLSGQEPGIFGLGSSRSISEYKKINNIVFKEIDKNIKSLSGTIDSIEKE